MILENSYQGTVCPLDIPRWKLTETKRNNLMWHRGLRSYDFGNRLLNHKGSLKIGKSRYLINKVNILTVQEEINVQKMY